jgi:hypothetical protein
VLKVGGKDYSYLSWADAMKIVLIEFPDMQYEVTRQPSLFLFFLLLFSFHSPIFINLYTTQGIAPLLPSVE